MKPANGDVRSPAIISLAFVVTMVLVLTKFHPRVAPTFASEKLSDFFAFSVTLEITYWNDFYMPRKTHRK